MCIIGERDPSCLNWSQIPGGQETQSVPGKVAEEWRWVAIFSLHENSRPGREHKRDDREGTEGGGGGWVSLPSYNVGGLWTQTTHS